MDIQLVTVNPTTRRVSFGLKPKKLAGISKLVQIVILSLLNVPGKDVLDPAKGGGLPALIGSNIDLEDSGELFAEITRRVRKTELEITTDQIGLALEPAEKLREIRIVSIVPGEQIDEVTLRVRVVNELGQSSDVVI